MAFITSHFLQFFGGLPTAAVTHMPTNSILIIPPMDLDQVSVPVDHYVALLIMI
jgi:hypothetical protein